MALIERLREDMKQAMKAREAGKLRLSVIRMALAALKNKQIELGRELEDDDVVAVLHGELKRRREAAREYRELGRDDVAEVLEQEAAVIVEYLPQQLDEREIRELAREVIAELGASGPRDMGKVMGAIMPRVRGRADGKEVNRIVRELLQSQ